MPITKAEYTEQLRAEQQDLLAFLKTLADEQWDVPSLCDGWKVRHVVSHITYGYTAGLPTIAWRLLPYRFNVPAGSKEVSIQYGDSHRPAEILTALEGGFAHPKGLGRLIPPHERLTDHLIHQQDIRRPLSLTRDFPRERLVAVLDALPRIGGFMQSKKRVAGLRLVATDIDHTVGEGAEVRGPAESLILAASGRTVGLDALSGEGASILTDRLKS